MSKMTDIFIICCRQLNGFKYCNLTLFNNSHLFAELNGFKNKKWLNISIWYIDGNLTDTTILGQSGPGSNDNEGGISHTPKLQG